jgi:uncharacterized protein (UPF0332 family)
MAVITNQRITKEGRDEENAKIAADWIRRANDHLQAARSLLAKRMPAGAAPAAHSAIYAATRAVLRLRGLALKDPRRAYQVFNARVVKPGYFAFDLMAHAETVEKIRELADYYELAPIPKAQARYAVNAAAKFVAAVEKYFKESKRGSVKERGKAKR